MQKIYFCLILIIVSMPLYSFDFSPGFYAGPTMAWYSGKGFDEYMNDMELKGYSSIHNNPKIGFTLGILANMGFTDCFSIQPEIIWNNNGGGVSGKKDDEDIVHFINEITLELPVLFKFSFSIGLERVTLFAGPFATFLLMTPEYFDLVDSEISIKSMNREDFSTFGYGVMAGVGYDFILGSGIFFLEGRYSYDFSDSMDKYLGMDCKQQSTYLIIGYRFKMDSTVLEVSK